MLTIYHVPNTRGFRLVWLCEELEIPYSLSAVDFSQEYRASAEWRRMNPVGKVPVVVDGEQVLFESGAIVQYLLDRYGQGRLQPDPSSPEHGVFLQWCWFAEATFGRATGELANHKRAFAQGTLPEVMEEMRNRARSALHAVEERLGGRRYLVGDDFSAADVMMGYTLGSFTRHVGDAFPPNVAAYWTRITERPAFVAADAAQKMA